GGGVRAWGRGGAGGGAVSGAGPPTPPPAAGVAPLTFLFYVFAYPPPKRRTPLNTLVGAISGALPPVIGWTAVRGSLNAEIGALFVVLFLWQGPRFLAVASVYPADSWRAGLRVFPSLALVGHPARPP